MPTDRWIIDRAIDAYRGRYPHPTEYTTNDIDGNDVVSSVKTATFDADLAALIEHVIDYVKQEESK